MRSLRLLSAALLLAAAVSAPAALAGQSRTEAIVLSPEPGERVSPREVLVAVSFYDPTGQIDPTSVSLRVGDIDYTPEAQFRGGLLTWQPRAGATLAAGPQRVVVAARDRSGRLVDATWTFNVTTLEESTAVAPAPQATPLGTTWGRPHGTIVLEGATQQVSGVGAPLRRGEDFLPLMWLNAGGVIRPGWRYSTRIHVSGYESADRQPVNRFRLDLRTPFANLAGGDVNPVFQDLILAGRRVRGVQGELWAGPARIAVVTGQSRRAVRGLLDPTDPSVISRYGTYGQNLFAVRPSFGTGGLFQGGLTVMRVRDDVGSISDLRTQSPGLDFGTIPVNVAPKDNLVAGLDLTFRLVQGRLLLRYENAVSMFANDISGGPVTEQGLDSLLTSAGIDPIHLDPSRFERFFIINSSMIPLDPREQSNVAHQARASLTAGTHVLSAEFRSVGGSYYTLGYQALQRDLRGFRLRDSFSALNSALVVSLGVERDRDNLDDVKLATTTSTGGFANVNWQPSPGGVALTGTVRLGTRSNSLPRGEFGALDEQNRMVSLGASLPVGQLSALATRVSLNASFVDRDDPRNPLSGSRDMYYLAGLSGETESRESMLGLFFGVNMSDWTGYEDAETNLYRLATSARHRFAPRWTGTFDGSIAAARSPEASLERGLDYNRLELLGGGEFEWIPAATVGLTAGLVSYTDNRYSARDTRELIARLRVTRAF